MAGQGSLERAVRSELRSLRVSVQTDGRGALAVSLARQIDSARGAVAAAAAAAQLRGVLDDLAKRAAQAPRESGIDDLRARRARRIG
jgi:hypothetical protein